MSTSTISAHDLAEQLRLLRAERSLAELHGLAADTAYLADLEAEIRHTTAAYVGAAVTEIASLRGRLSGPLHG
ncbi:hypothetical protein FSW04_15015 [Baekduia soli]|uniref:Uncharacterized protein n=1 Tax=Baekduia soli TaxID=496014 RepID=A0A5B8U7U3_9ACTN|nr:hypothetical protein [Baekduia soli]QEC48752.1 hypothetical protein FSW04_15015 [Baekduia soli]